MIPNAVVVLNGKGGVLKTSLAANLAGLAALSEWKVLAVDLDPQGNLARDLGFIAQADDGAALADAVRARRVPEPLRDIRPGLDVLAGGSALDEMIAALQRDLLSGRLSAVDAFEAAIAPLAPNYNIVIIDSPPGDALLHSAALRAAHYILIPTRADAASIDGLGRVASGVAAERAANPALEVLGVALGPLPTQAHALARRARAELESLLGAEIPVFDTVIRDAPKAAVDCRAEGRLAHEYEQAALDATPWWKLKRAGKTKQAAGERYSSAAAGLAADYQALAQEILGRFSERQAALTGARS